MIEYKKATLKNINELITLRIKFLKEVQKTDDDKNDKILFDSLKKYFNNKMKKNEFISWLAFKNDIIVATSGICFYQIPPSLKNISGKIAYIMNMYTKPEFRKQGIATNLFIKMMDEAKKVGIKKLVLHATEDGKKIYLKHGFKEEHKEMILFLD